MSTSSSSTKHSRRTPRESKFLSKRSSSLSSITLPSTSFSDKSVKSRKSTSRNSPAPSLDRLRYSRHSIQSESIQSTSSSPYPDIEVDSRSSSRRKNRSVASTPRSRASNKSPSLTRARSHSPSRTRRDSKDVSPIFSPQRSPSSIGSGAALRRMSTDSSSSSVAAISRWSDIILRKAYKNGRWYEEREETIWRLKPDGKISKRSNLSQSEIHNTETPGTAESLSSVDPNFLDIDRGMQLIPKNTRGIIQDDQEEFGKEIVMKINLYRLEHEAKSIKLNRKLSVYAREWAKYLARNAKIGFSNRHDVGECIYVKTLSEPWTKIAGDDIVSKWYSEMETHNYDTDDEIIAANFTQLVWRSTKEVGVAMERSTDGVVAYIVVFFHPKGNFPGDIVKQVHPIGGKLLCNKNEKGLLAPHAVQKDESFANAVLRATNYYRLLHGVMPLVLDKALTEYAQDWAEEIALQDKICERPKNIYGENIYRSSFKINSDLHGQEPVEYWYRTKRFYTPNNTTDIRAAPFTQLVWNDSRDIGVGYAKSKSDRTYVTAYFNPPGNRVGHFSNQVFPMKWNSSL